MGAHLIIPVCEHCGGINVKIRRQIAGNGTMQFAWRCVTCNRWAQIPPVWLRHEMVIQVAGNYGKTTDEIPIVEDYRGNNLCAVCGSPDTEWHHFAPKAYAADFGNEWAAWPCVYLCREHHRLWHDIVTPDLSATTGEKEEAA